jgi:hypothetical protein
LLLKKRTTVKTLLKAELFGACVWARAMASPVFIVVELCTSFVGPNANPRNYQVSVE